MMSKALSSENKRVDNNRPAMSQRQLTARRLWPLALSALVYLLFHIAGAAIVLSGARNSYLQQMQAVTPPSQTLAATMTEVSLRFWGPDSPGLFLAVLLGVILGLQGFGWLHNPRTVDFYESQPVSRFRRFTETVLNSHLLFLAPLLVTMVPGLLICAAYGADLRLVLPQAGAYFLRSLFAFWAGCALGTLSAMLTGNGIVSILAACVFLLYEVLLRTFLFLLMDSFFKTFADTAGILGGRLWTSPFWNAYSLPLWESILRNAVLGLLLLLLAWAAYSMRQNEMAGSAVLFAPIRTVVKIAVAFIGSLGTGLLMTAVSGAGAGVLCGVLAAVIIGCIMEIIYAYNLKAMLHEPASLILPALMTAALLLVCRYDLIGYDRWVPSADRVTDAAFLSNSSSGMMYYSESGTPSFRISDYCEKYMHLTNKQDVIRLAQYLVDTQAAGSASDIRRGESVTILYRMKNGAIRRRIYQVPAGTDSALLDAVIDTPEFREGFFPVFHDAYVSSLEKGLLRIRYSNLSQTGNDEPVDYAAFREAYIKDLEQYSLAFLSRHSCIGSLDLFTYSGGLTADGREIPYVHITYPVYEGFTQTIRFLQESGVYLEPAGPATVSEIRVELTDYDYSAPESLSTPPVMVCTDSAQIEEILSHSLCLSWGTPFNSLIPYEEDWNITAYTDDPYQRDALSLVFLPGEVPAFVTEDFAALRPGNSR